MITLLFGFGLTVQLLADINVTKTVVGYGYEYETTLVGETVEATGVCVADDAASAYTYLVDNDYILPSLPEPCESNTTTYSQSIPDGYVLAEEELIDEGTTEGCDNDTPCRYDLLLLDTKRFRVDPSNYDVTCRFGVQSNFYYDVDAYRSVIVTKVYQQRYVEEEPPPSDPNDPSKCRDEVSSYIVPKTRALHEDIAIAGSAVGLHYNSRYASGYVDSGITIADPVAQGWTLNVRHYFDGTRLLRGDGSVDDDVNATTDATGTIVRDKHFAYTFDADMNHIATRTVGDDTLVYAFTYDGSGVLLYITDAFGNTLHLNYDASGNVDLIEAPNGQLTSLQINAVTGNLERVSYEDASAYDFSYDTGGLMRFETEPRQNVFEHVFDADGRITSVIDPEGGTWGYSATSTASYDESVISYPENEQTIYRNYPLSNGFWESTATYANGDTTSVKTSEDQRIVIKTQCGVTRTELYGENHPVTNAKRLTSVTVAMPSGLTQSTTYAYSDTLSNGTLLSTQTLATTNGKTAETFEDFTAHEKIVITPEGRTTTMHFSPDGNLDEILPAGLYATSYIYDEAGKLIHSDTNGERSSFYTYDAKGNLESSTDALQRTTLYGYDARDRLASITYPDTHQSFFTYDDNGNMETLTTPTPGENLWNYNGVNKATLWRTPLSEETLYTYDKKRRLTLIERPSGKTLTHGYANGQRVDTDTTERSYAYAYDCGNKLQSVLASDGEEVAYTYDGDLLTGIAQTGTLNEAIGFSNNEDFLFDSITYAGATQPLAYDNDALLIQNGRAVIARSATTGLVQQVSDGTFTQTRTHNGFGETQSVSDAINAKELYAYAITSRDATGRIIGKSERIGGRQYKYSYAYDDRGRLIQSNATSYKMVLIPYDGLVIPVIAERTSNTESYTYDANGNRLSKTLNGTEVSATHTIADQLETVGSDVYAYDLDGYLSSKITSEGTTHYTYGTLGELRSVVKPDNTVIEYLHNANNQRVAKKVDGTVTEKYLWKDLTTLLAVYDGNDNLKIRFEYADGRMPYKMAYEGQTYYLHYDQVGSLRTVSAENGTIIKTIEYGVFGDVLSDSNPSFEVPFGFAGGLYDLDTGLIRFGYRDYDGETGKWTAKDPIGFSGGDTNLYGYVLNDPVNMVDSSGLILPALLPLVPAGADLLGIGIAALGATAAQPYITEQLNDLLNDEGLEEESCAEEWDRAYERCEQLLTNNNSCQNRGLTGGYTDLQSCARGLVSQRCGGNAIDWGN